MTHLNITSLVKAISVPNKVISLIHHNESIGNKENNISQSTESLILDQLDCIAPNKDAGTYYSLTLDKYRRAFLVGIMITFVQQLSGINLIIFYGNRVVLFHKNFNEFTLILGAINVLSTVVSVILLRSNGRKKLLLNGLLAMGAANGTLFLLFPLKNENLKNNERYLDVGFIILFIIFLVSFATTLGTISWLYLAEIMTELGMSIAVALNWFIVILVSYIPSIVPKFKNEESKDIEDKNEPNLEFFFFFFSGGGIVGFFMVSLYLKETKGLNSKQILNLYSDKQYDPFQDSDDSDNDKKSPFSSNIMADKP